MCRSSGTSCGAKQLIVGVTIATVLVVVQLIIIIIIIIIMRNLYSAIMPLGGYRGAGGTGR